MAGTATYPTGAIRDALERAANDPELPASARQRELRTIRDELKHLAGYADSLLGELSLAEQRDALDDDTDFRLAEDAAIREEMLRRGLATEEQLDELGLHPTAEVAERRADGTLAESVSAADFLPYLHPRGRAGQFVDAPLVRKGIFDKGQRVHWDRDGETFGGTVAGPPDADGFVPLDVAGVTVAVHSDRLRHGPVPASQDPRLTGIRRDFPVGSRVRGEADGEVTGHALAGPALDEPSVKVRNSAGVETYHDPTGLDRLPERPREHLPESMPPPRPDDPLVALGLPPLVVDGLRADEPEPVLDLPADQRREEEERIGRELLARPDDWPEFERRARERWELWRDSPGHDPASWKPPEGVTYSPEVQKIASPADAEAYLKGRGVDARLTPPDTAQGRNLAADTDWFRQIAQAVTDAQDRYPVLKEGPHPLGVVGLWSDTPMAERADTSVSVRQDSVWASTGYALADPDLNPRGHAITASQDDPPDRAYKRADFEGQKTDVVISDVNQDFLQSRTPTDGISDAAVTPYGRMMHELGHAVWSASGLQDEDLEETGNDPYQTVENLVADHLTPRTAMAVSDYAAYSVTEGWAEFFSTLNVPGALETVARRNPATANALEALRVHANQIGAERGVGKLL